MQRSDDSPPPFIVIRTPAAISQHLRVKPYRRGLELVGLVAEIVEVASARFYLKDRLDRAATNLVFALGRAEDARIGKWRDYRTAVGHASDVATLLDILEHQRAVAPQLLEKAQRATRDLLADISPLANG
jgi:hypothetical protein